MKADNDLGLEELDLTTTGGRQEALLFRRTATAFGWRFAAEAARCGLQVAVLVVLARLLPVEAFGLLSLSMIIINFALRIAELGVTPALIQRKEISDSYVRVAFSLAVLSGLLVTALIWVTAPLAGALFQTDAVIPVIRLMSFAFLFTSVGSVAGALLERRLDYRKFLGVELVSYGFGYALVSIVLALLDYGVWALAWGTVVTALLRSVLLFLASPHAAQPRFTRHEAGELLNFGVGIILGRIANQAAANADYFVVGRWLGSGPLGLYSRAYQLICLPMYQFSSVIAYVLFPAYSIIQDQVARLRHAYLASVALSALVIFPTLTGLAIGAPEIMTGVFGPKWTGATVPFQILCIGGCLQAVFTLADALARSKAAVYAKFWRHVAYALFVFGAALVARPWGITGVAIGVDCAIIAIYLLMAQLSIRLIKTTWSSFFASQLPGVVLAAAVAALVVPTTYFFRAVGLPVLAVLTSTIVLSVVAAVAAGFLLPARWLSAPALDVVVGVKRGCFFLFGKERLKKLLRRSPIAYRVAEALYENFLYFPHIMREGLWRMLVGVPRLRSTPHQAPLTWRLSLTPSGVPRGLMGRLEAQGVRVLEGGHTFYIPPQERLRELIPSVVDFYPPGSGFKVLKDPRAPSHARYLNNRHRYLLLLMRLMGKPQDQVIAANYMHALGIGPQVWDLTCWQTETDCYTVFVVEHISGPQPTLQQCEGFLNRLETMRSSSHLRVLIPRWKENEDFLPPHCNQNLIYSPARDCTQYVDFQNFGLTSAKAWSREVVSQARWNWDNGRHGPPRRGSLLQQSVAEVSRMAKRNTAKRWLFLKGSLDKLGIEVRGRLVLDVGCTAGMTLRACLVAGATWCFGWDVPYVIAPARDFLFSLGATRFSLIPAHLHPRYRLHEDIPARFEAALRESVVFFLSARQHPGLVESLARLPWRALVYGGHQSERLEDLPHLLQPILTSKAAIAEMGYLADGESSARPIAILVRKDA